MQLCQGQAVPVKLGIGADSPLRAAAVIPEDQAVPLCRVIFPGVIQEESKGIRLPHILQLPSPDRLGPALFQQVNIAGSRGKAAEPALAAAGHQYHIHTVRVKAGVEHLRDILRCGAAVAFQIGAAEVDHQGHVLRLRGIRLHRADAAEKEQGGQ